MAKATDGRNISARQVTNSPTRGPEEVCGIWFTIFIVIGSWQRFLDCSVAVIKDS